MPNRVLILIIIACMSIAGCATPTVQPWQRNILSQNEMQLVPDRTEQYFNDHIYFSRQGAVGGGGAGAGGGCGCN